MKSVKIGDKTFYLPFVDAIPFNDAQVQDLSDSIEETKKILVHVVCWKEKTTPDSYHVVDGAHRIIIAGDKGITKIPIMQRSFESEAEALEECNRLNYDRRQLNQEQQRERRTHRREKAASLRAEGQSERQIAETLGVSDTTIHRDLETTASHEAEVENVVGKDGKQRTASVKPKLYCPECKTKIRKGQELPSRCENCGLLRKAARKPKTLREQIDEVNHKDEEPVEETIEDKIKGHNHRIETFCRSLMKFTDDNIPDDPWLNYQGRKKGALAKVKEACETLRTCKCSTECPACKGVGCKECLKTGRVTKFKLDMMV